MTSDNSLYWVYIETDTSHPELYLPPDTPTGKVNPKRVYTILRKRHARQWERLKIQQSEELCKYHRTFSMQYQDDLFIKPTTTACELTSGTSFLNSYSDAISELLSSIPSIIAENNRVKEHKPKKDKSDRRRQDYLGILAKKYNTGFETIEELHQSQVYQLNQIQRQELKVIPREITDPVRERSLKSRITSTSPPVSTQSESNSKKRRRTEEHMETSKKHRKDDKSKTKKTSSKTEKSSHDKADIIKKSSPLHPHPPKPKPKKTEKTTDARPPVLASAGTRPPVISSGGTRPPSIGVGIPTNARPPTVGSSFTPPNSLTSKQMKQRPSDALFPNKKLVNNKIDTLMNRGSLIVQNKPNRVIIRSQNGTTTTYGNPKDYDDAINSSNTRADNPVHKRRIFGKEYLFYKIESGHVVTIGPVSEIQPLIHKFFLSM